MNIAKVEPGSNCSIFVLEGMELAVIVGCKVAGAFRILGIDINKGKFAKAKEFGSFECFIAPNFSKPTQEVLIEMPDEGLNYSFECISNVKGMRAALEAAHKGWAVSVVVGVAVSGEELITCPFHPMTGHTWKGGWKIAPQS